MDDDDTKTHQFDDFQYSGNRLEVCNVKCNPAQWSGIRLIRWGRLWWCIISTWINCNDCFRHHILLRNLRCVTSKILVHTIRKKKTRIVLWPFCFKLNSPDIFIFDFRERQKKPLLILSRCRQITTF